MLTALLATQVPPTVTVGGALSACAAATVMVTAVPAAAMPGLALVVRLGPAAT